LLSGVVGCISSTFGRNISGNFRVVFTMQRHEVPYRLSGNRKTFDLE